MTTRFLKDILFTLNSTANGGIQGIAGNSETIPALIDPTTPQDAATKNYVDNQIGGFTHFFFDLTSPPSSVNIVTSTEIGNAFSVQYSATIDQFSFANNNAGGGNNFNISFVTQITVGGVTKLVAAPMPPFLPVIPPSVFHFSADGTLDSRINNSANNSFLTLVFTAINAGTDQRLYMEAQVLKTSSGRTIWGWYRQT